LNRRLYRFEQFMDNLMIRNEFSVSACRRPRTLNVPSMYDLRNSLPKQVLNASESAIAASFGNHKNIS